VTVEEHEVLARRFEAERPRLRAIAYRMLGSLAEADDAVQEAWLQASRAGVAGIANVSGWLTTVVARVCLNLLRARRTRREQLQANVPEPVVDGPDGVDPEHHALLVDAVGFALLVVLDALAPAERLAFVLHDLFDVPFDEIAPIVERSPTATRQLASRARRRVRAAAPSPDRDPARQREVVDAFLAAARDGDLDALVAVLDPDVVLRAHTGPVQVRRGARDVADGALAFRSRVPYARPALVNGAAGLVVERHGRRYAIMAFTVVSGRIATVDILTDLPGSR
jgi:RNA polymerase sigma-70 factor (ECF subfamily)